MTKTKIRLMRALPYDDVEEMLYAERGNWRQSDRFTDDQLLDFVQSSALDWDAERFAFCVDVSSAGVGYVTAHRSDDEGFNMLRLWLRNGYTKRDNRKTPRAASARSPRDKRLS